MIRATTTPTPIFKGVRNTLRLAVPLMAAQLAIISHGIVDTLTFGLQGELALAAGGLALAFLSLVNIILVGVLAAVGIEVSHLFAAPRGAARREVVAGLHLSLFLTLPTVALLLLVPRLLTLAGQDAELSALAGDYLLWAAPSVLGSMVFTTFRGLLVGLRMPGPITAITAAAVGLKAVLNGGVLATVGRGGDPALFLAVCGAATTVVNMAMALQLWRYALRHLADASPGPRTLRGAAGRTRRLFTLGAPIGLTYGLESGALTAMALIMGRFGTEALAAHNIANQCIYLPFMISVGISHATSVNIGNAAGERDHPAEVRRYGLQGLALGLIAMTGTALIFHFFSADIARAFISGENEQLIAMTSSLLSIAAVFQWGDGTQNIAMGALRGMRRARSTMICGFLGYWLVGLPLAYALSEEFGPAGVWWGILIGFYTTAALLVFWFLRSSSTSILPKGVIPNDATRAG